MSEIFNAEQWRDFEIWVIGSSKLIENGTIQQIIHDFLSCHCNYLVTFSKLIPIENKYATSY